MYIKQKILFNKTECNSIICNDDDEITDWNKNDRKYNSRLIKYGKNSKWLFDKLKNFFESETDFEIIKIKENIHFHKFTQGDWFGLHNDVRESRLYAVGVLLNDDFIGGDFKFYDTEEMILDKVLGNTYLFDVRVNHEITPILEGNRYSLLWFLQNQHIKMKTNKLI